MNGMKPHCAVAVAMWSVMVSQGIGVEWNLKVPQGGVGFNFGPAAIPGLTAVSRNAVYSDQTGHGFVSSDGLTERSGERPDTFSGRFVLASRTAEFRAKVPNGDYLVWLCAGKMISAELRDRRFLLKLNDKALCDDTPNDEDFASEKYLYRFMWTQYSERPHAIWEDFVDKSYASYVEKITVNDGQISVSLNNHFISALIAVPASQKAGFDALIAEIRNKRIEEFETEFKKKADPAFLNAKKTEKQSGDGDYLVYAPDEIAPRIWPSTGPSEKERKQTGIVSGGTPGERILMKLAVVPFADLGKSTLVLADLKGPGSIPSANISGFYKNYRFVIVYDGKYLQMGESALMPSLTLNVEKGVTEVFCLNMLVPEDAKAGIYNGTFTFKPEKGKSLDVPVQFEVYPFKLEKDLPVSYTMWNSCGYFLPFLSADMKRKILKDRLIVEREMGFTSLDVPGPIVRSAKGGKATIAIDSMPYEVAKEVGMGRRPEQGLYVANFMAGAGRSLAVALGAGSGPGDEFKNPEFKTYLKDAIAQFRAFIDKSGLPVVVCAVDEPREYRIQPWNRNYDDTCVYADMLRAGGIRTMVNPMADASGKKAYTGFVDHLDVYSSHAWNKSEKSFKLAREKGKTIWLYNSGMDRYTWGFYNWRFKSQGRMEWQFSDEGENSAGREMQKHFGYPGKDWFNQLNGRCGLAPSAPYAKYRGGHLFQSSYSEVSMGITDYAYIYTLTETLKTMDVIKPGTARDAADFLASLERAMPEFPQIKGLASAEDGPKVGMGANDDARYLVDEWRRKIAGFLKELKK